MSEPTTPLSDVVAPTVALPPTLEVETIPPSDVRPAAGTSGPVLAPLGYEIVRELGRGGMGVVYEARQTKLLRTVALKMILAGAHAGESELARFRTEAEAIARLQHPHIVQIHEVGDHGGLPYFALEYCAGGSLEKKLAGTPLAPREAAALVEPLARAMQIAHDKGVIHRDLKPANVLLGEDGSPKITDFGLAKKLDEAGQTASGAVMGTPSYMAPEQAGYKPEAQARSIGPAADVYALGAILYECLTGRPPFKAATPLDTILLVVSVEPAAPSLFAPQVPRDLETICLKCLQKEPAKRYASALALADDLHRFLAGEPIVARPVGRAERAWKWARRRPAAAALLAVSVLAALALLGTISIAAALIYGKNHDLIEQRDRANKEAEKARIAGEEAHAEAKKARSAEGQAQEKEKEARDQAEKAENRLLDGLLRPIGHNWNPQLDPAEKQALAEVVDLDARLRLRFVQRGLETSATAERLGRRIVPLIDAVAGKDAEMRGRLRELALTALHQNGADWHVHVAGTMLAEPLGETTPALAQDGAAALLEGIARSGDEMGRTRYRNLFHVLTPHLDAAGLRATARTAIDLLPSTSARAALTQEIATLTRQMEAAQAAMVCAEAAASLLPLIRQEIDASARAQLAREIAALAQQMEPAQATKVCAEAAAPLLQALGQGPKGPTSAQLGDTLAALARQMDAAQAAQICGQATPPLLQAISKETNVQTLERLAGVIKAFAPQMDSATAREAATALLQSISKKGTSFARTEMVWTMPVLAQRMDGAAAGAAVRTGLDLIPTAGDGGGRYELPRAIAKLAPAMDAAAARATVRRALELISQATTPPAAHAALAQVVADLAPRMDWDGDGARAAVKSLLQVLHDEPDDLARAGVAHTVAELARHMNADGTREATPLLVQALSQQSNPLARAGLARAIAALAPRMDDAAAREAVAPLLQLIKKEVDATARNQLAQSVAALAGHLDTAQAAKVCAEAAAPVFQAINLEDSKTPPFGLMATMATVAALAPHLDAAGARAAAKSLLAAIDKTDPNGFGHMALAGAISSLAPQMDGATGREVTTALLQAIPKEKNDLARIALAQAVAALARPMDAAQTTAVCTEAADALLQTLPKNPSAMARFQLTLAVTALAHRMDSVRAAKVRTQVTPLLLQAPGNDPLGLERFQLALGVAILARQMDSAPAAKLCAQTAAPLVQAISDEKRNDARARLAQAVVKLAAYMDPAEASRAAAITAAALLDTLKRPTDNELLLLAEAFGGIAEWTAPRDLADLLAKHHLPPAVAEAILRRLEPLACRRFDTIDEAVRWFHEGEPAPPQS